MNWNACRKKGLRPSLRYHATTCLEEPKCTTKVTVSLTPDLAGVRTGSVRDANQKHHPLHDITTHNKYLMQL